MPIAVVQSVQAAPSIDEYARLLVAGWPPIPQESLERVAALFRAGSK